MNFIGVYFYGNEKRGTIESDGTGNIQMFFEVQDVRNICAVLQ
jgi:hypothetical protein